jgi:hypothetical protein
MRTKLSITSLTALEAVPHARWLVVLLREMCRVTGNGVGQGPAETARAVRSSTALPLLDTHRLRPVEATEAPSIRSPRPPHRDAVHAVPLSLTYGARGARSHGQSHPAGSRRWL